VDFVKPGLVFYIFSHDIKTCRFHPISGVASPKFWGGQNVWL